MKSNLQDLNWERKKNSFVSFRLAISVIPAIHNPYTKKTYSKLINRD